MRTLVGGSSAAPPRHELPRYTTARWYPGDIRSVTELVSRERSAELRLPAAQIAAAPPRGYEAKAADK